MYSYINKKMNCSTWYKHKPKTKAWLLCHLFLIFFIMNLLIQIHVFDKLPTHKLKSLLLFHFMFAR